MRATLVPNPEWQSAAEAANENNTSSLAAHAENLAAPATREYSSAAASAVINQLLVSANQPQGDSMATEREVSEQAIAAAEARTDAKIAAMTGEMRTIAATLGGKLDTLGEKLTSDHEYNRSTRWVMIGLAVALAGLLVTMATYGDALFSRGMNVRDVIQNTIKDYDALKKPPQPAN